VKSDSHRRDNCGVSGVTRGGGGPPWATPSRGMTPEQKIVGKFTKNSGQTRSDR